MSGRRGTWRHLSSFHVAGVPLGDIHLRFTWQACHLATSTFVLCGKRGTGCTWSPLVAVGRRWSPVTPRHFAWQAWHLATSIFVSCIQQACHLATSTCVSRGRRGTWRHLPSFCVAGVLQVALGRRWSPLVTPRHFAWQACNLATSIFVSCGRRATWRHPPAFHVAGVALGDIYLRFVWQAWYRLHLVARLVAVGRW